jgi:hypothetical protein
MPKTSSPKTCSCRPRTLALALLGALVSLASPAPAQAPDSAQPGAETAAKEQFSRAVKLYKEGKAEQALPLFLEVANATRSPNARLYVGHCLVQLHKYVEAYRAFALTVKETGQRNSDKYDATREAAQAQLAVLSARVARLVISLADIPQGLAVAVDGTSVEEKELGAQLALEPGAHSIEARADGVVGVKREVNIEDGEVKTITLSFQKLEPGPPKAEATTSRAPAPTPAQADTSAHGGTLRTLGFVAGGVGVAGFAVFTVAGLSAKSTYDQLSRECGSAGCADSAHRDAIDRGKSQQTVANLGLIVGAVGIAAGGTLLLLGLSQHPDTGASVALAPGGGTISYLGTF